MICGFLFSFGSVRVEIWRFINPWALGACIHQCNFVLSWDQCLFYMQFSFKKYCFLYSYFFFCSRMRIPFYLHLKIQLIHQIIFSLQVQREEKFLYHWKTIEISSYVEEKGNGVHWKRRLWGKLLRGMNLYFLLWDNHMIIIQLMLILERMEFLL